MQWLALKIAVVLKGALSENDTDWIVARVAAGDDSDIWGLGSLVELQVLGTWLNNDEARAQAEVHLRRMVDRCAGRDPFPIKSTLEQLARYDNWWGVDETLALPGEVR
jgi:hypothetical protein